MDCRFVLIVLFLSAIRLHAEDWPQWRGPNRNAVSRETGLMKQWPVAGPKNIWRVSGLGEAYSSVVVGQGRVFTIGRQGNDVLVFALDSERGELRWTQKIGETERMPCSTPTIDGDRVYALDPDGDLVCLKTATGEIIWQRSFFEDFKGRMQSGRGYGESPLIDGEKLICTPGGVDTMLVALNKLTGKTIWQSKVLELGKAGNDGAGFSSVVISEAAGVRQYVQLIGRGVVGIAAEDGKFLWGYNDLAARTANIPTPVVSGDFVFAANGYNTGSVLLRLKAGEKGGVVAEEMYRLNGSRFQNHHGGVALIGDHVFGGHGSNNGLPTCIEFETGRVIWKRRGPGIGSAAMVYADGQLYFRYQNGLVALIEANAVRYKLNGTFSIPGAGGDSWAHPVVANGKLYLREKDHLWVYDVRARSDAIAVGKSKSPAFEVEPFLALRKMNVTVEPAEAKHSLYRYAGGPLIALSNSHVTPSGVISDRVMSLLRELKTPFALSLAGTRVTDPGLKQVSELASLAALNLELCPEMSDVGIARLQGSDSLRVLILTGTAITNKGLTPLTKLPNLTALDLEVCDGITDEGCVTIATLSKLKALILKKTGFEPEKITGAGLKHLSSMTHLEWLDLYGASLTDDALNHLQPLQNLRRLDLSLTAITDEGVVRLKKLHRLESLDLLFSTGFAGPVLTDDVVQTLQSLNELRTLNLVGSQLSDEGLGKLSNLPDLRRVDVVGTRVTPAGIKQFQQKRPTCKIRN